MMRKEFFLLLISSVLIVSCSTNKREVPFSGPFNVVNGDTIRYVVPQFKFENQDKVSVNNDSYLGKVYAMNFFFSACPVQCPMVTNNLTVVHNEFKGNDQVMLVSVTLDPESDTPKRLKKYAVEGYGIDTKYWDFLRAGENYTFSFMNNSFFQPGAKDEKEQGGIGHSANVVLVDQEGRFRSWYDGREPDELEQLVTDIKTLLNE